MSGDVDEAEGSALVDLLQEIRDLLQSRGRIASAGIVDRRPEGVAFTSMGQRELLN